MSAALKASRPDADAREALAVAIAEFRERTERVAGIQRAKENLFEQRLEANRSVEAAKEAAEHAKQAAADSLVSKALGGADVGAETITDARWQRDELQQHLRDLESADTALSQQLPDAERAARWAAQKLRSAVAEALAAAPEVQRLFETYRRKQKEVAALASALRFVAGKGGMAAYWDATPADLYDDASVLQIWQAAIAALERDPNAQLPQ